jgi:molybdopterin converting factor small subunit
VNVNLPTPLIEYTAGARNVEASGDSLAGVLADLDQRYPGIRFRMVDEQEQIRAHIKFFINGELTRSLAMPVQSGDTLLIVAALSGG